MKTVIQNTKGVTPSDEEDEPNWPVIIPILVVMVGLMVAFYFMN